jgi:hypothetical protein
MSKLTATVIALIGLTCCSAYADSIDGVAINGAIGGSGGHHTLDIDGVKCTLKNSTNGPNEGCNYTLSGGINSEGQGSLKATTSNPGCQASCK